MKVVPLYFMTSLAKPDCYARSNSERKSLVHNVTLVRASRRERRERRERNFVNYPASVSVSERQRAQADAK